MEEAMRLDVYVVKQLVDKPRTYARKLIDEEKVLVNGKPQKASYHLRDKDVVTIPDVPSEPVIPSIDIPILYEDDDCVVINKPVGLLTHSKGAFNPEPTVATWLAEKYGLDTASGREGIVHRLDRGTSGLMICAKTPEALKFLQKQFSTRKVKKTYMAIVEGGVHPEEAIIDMAIERNPKQPQRFRVGINGKSATTHYKVIDTFEQKYHKFSLLELKPTTGRTHQLRVHLKHLKHTIVGDDFYHGLKAQRLYLHAHVLELTLPSKERKVFTAPLPNDFKEPKL